MLYVAQLTFQAAQFQAKDGAAPVLVTPRVARWVERIHWALARYGEGEYAEAARLADITGASKYFEWLVPREGRGTR